MKIQIAQKNDLPQMVEIYNQAIREGTCTADTDEFSLEERRNWFETYTKERPLLVAKEGEEVLGYLTITPYRYGRKALQHTAEVSYYIHFNHHRKEVGSQLLSSAVNMCPSLQIKTLIAILIGSNQGSVGLLEKYGFKEWGRMPNIVELGDNKYDHLYFGIQIK